MTSEGRLLIEPSDVLTIELSCKNCGATLGKKPSESPLAPQKHCHNCPEELLPQGSSLSSAVIALSQSLAVLSKMRNEAKFALRLHVANFGPSGNTASSGQTKE